MAVEIADPKLGGIDPLAPLARNDRFETLYARYYPMLVSTCTSLTHDRAAAEDVAQETLLRAYVHLEFLDERRAWPWLKRVATNLIIDESRKRKREVISDTETQIEEQPAWTDDGGDAAGLLTEALSKLSRRQKIALGLRYAEDWEPDEAAAYLDLGGSAFKQLLFRARGKLREEYRRLSAGATMIALWPAALFRRGHEAIVRARAGLARATGKSTMQSALGVGAALVVLGVLAGTGPFRSDGGATPSPVTPSMFGLTAAHLGKAGHGSGGSMDAVGGPATGGALAGRAGRTGPAGKCVAHRAAKALASTKVGTTALGVVGPSGGAALNSAADAGCQSASDARSFAAISSMTATVKLTGGVLGIVRGAAGATAPPSLMVALKQALANGHDLPADLAEQLPPVDLPNADDEQKGDGNKPKSSGDQAADDNTQPAAGGGEDTT